MSVSVQDAAAGAADSRALRSALGRFATGVAVVTARAAGTAPVAMTINSFSSVSLAPPLVLFCVHRSASRLQPLLDAGHFAVHVLGASQRELSERCARAGEDVWRSLPWQVGADGAPCLDGCLARFECVLHASHDGGDHIIVVGRVQRHVAGDGAPLVFFRGDYHALRPRAA